MGLDENTAASYHQVIALCEVKLEVFKPVVLHRFAILLYDRPWNLFPCFQLARLIRWEPSAGNPSHVPFFAPATVALSCEFLQRDLILIISSRLNVHVFLMCCFIPSSCCFTSSSKNRCFTMFIKILQGSYQWVVWLWKRPEQFDNRVRLLQVRSSHPQLSDKIVGTHQMTPH